MNVPPMILRFCSGSTTPGEPVQEEVAGAGHVQVHAEGVAEHALHRLRFPVAEQPVVDEDAVELVADGPVQQGRDHRGVDAAAEAADHVVVAHLVADMVRRFR